MHWWCITDISGASEKAQCGADNLSKLSDCLTTRVSCPSRLHCCEHSGVRAARKDGQNYKNDSHVAINHSDPLRFADVI